MEVRPLMINAIHYERHYVQYNDLVFDGTGMVEEDDFTVNFKTFDSEYGFTHGSYSPHKRRGGLVKAASVSMTLFIDMRKLRCEDRPFFRRFALDQPQKHGRLWAVQDNILIWAFAEIKSYSESHSVKKNNLEIDVDFFLPEGVWHKADKQKTFLLPYDPCDALDCYDYHEIEPCYGVDGNCCICPILEKDEFCGCCDCVEKDMALCYHTDELQAYYECRGAPFKILYNCAYGQKFFMDSFYGTEHFGTRICTNNGLIAGQVYSDTDIPTSGITIMLHGHVVNPYIEINGNGNQIKAESDELMVIYPDGSVTVGNCGIESGLPVSSWVIPNGMEYGWEMHQGNNRIHIETGDCCATVCAYIIVDALTI